MDYLVYVEYNAENLQFFLWYKDYTKRFNALSDNEKALSKPWIPDTKEVPDLTKDAEKSEKKKSKRETNVANIMESGYAAKEAAMFSEDEAPLSPLSPPMSPTFGNKYVSSPNSGTATPSLAGSSAPSNAEVAAQAGLKWQPCIFSFL
jgi:hypothetical protein